MKPWLLPSGIQRGLPFILPDDWTPEQALAVVELLDDLRERICAHYEVPLHELLRELCQPIQCDEDPATDTSDPPF
jgi:hypothetical protein